MNSTLPLALNVVFDNDLPNGPYAEVQMMSMTMHCPGSVASSSENAAPNPWGQPTQPTSQGNAGPLLALTAPNLAQRLASAPGLFL